MTWAHQDERRGDGEAVPRGARGVWRDVAERLHGDGGAAGGDYCPVGPRAVCQSFHVRVASREAESEGRGTRGDGRRGGAESLLRRGGPGGRAAARLELRGLMKWSGAGQDCARAGFAAGPTGGGGGGSGCGGIGGTGGGGGEGGTVWQFCPPVWSRSTTWLAAPRNRGRAQIGRAQCVAERQCGCRWRVGCSSGGRCGAPPVRARP